MTEERLSRARFLRLGATLGVGAASASMIAACGGGGSGGEGGGAQGGETTGSGEPEAAGNLPGGETADVAGSGGTTATQVQEGGTAIAREADVAPGSAVEFTDTESGQPAVLVHLQDGNFAAYSAVCTHQGCTVAYRNGNLACPCHGSVFDPAAGGAVVSPPANTPLPEIPVEVRDGGVFRA